MSQLSHPTHGFHPAEDLFDSLALALADPIPGMPSGPSVNRTLATLVVLRYMRRGVHVARLRHEVLSVVEFVASYGYLLISGDLFDHEQSRIPLCCAGGLQHFHIRHQPVA